MSCRQCISFKRAVTDEQAYLVSLARKASARRGGPPADLVARIATTKLHLGDAQSALAQHLAENHPEGDNA